ncbi:MAG TPA: hypothetical protein VLW05_00225 [Gaiellaceae bacterium]|nr:hypothetical protein [Gaiellaceae bacterium]
MATKLVPLALVVLALAAVPVALGDGGGSTPPTAGTTPTATQGQAGNAVRLRLQNLRNRIELAGQRFAKHCGSGANGAPQQCTQFAQKIETRLQTLDSKVQAKIQTLQACTSSSTDQSCKNADKKVALLQKLDTRLQTLIQKVQAWLGGSSSSTGSSGSSTSDSGLDQAAAGLGQLTQQVGGVTP